jgi:gamma-glutamyltranspeptidase/glutathione hydrolase
MRQFEHLNLEHNSLEYLHFFAEATKHAFWCRLMYAGDPEISPPPLNNLLSDTYWNKISTTFTHEIASEFVPPVFNASEGKNTTHFVVADRWGNIVSATQTLGNLFGSKIMPEGTGIWMNNSLAYCTYEPKGNPMDATPGQRKLSGDCPVIIFKGKQPIAALGTPGGHTIAQTVPQMIMNLLEFGMPIDKAISAPRISFVEPNHLAIENTIPKSIVDGLISKGHQIKRIQALGNAHGLSFLYDDQDIFIGFKGAADPRGEGIAVGY